IVTIWIAHTTFCAAYVAVVVSARLRINAAAPFMLHAILPWIGEFRRLVQRHRLRQVRQGRRPVQQVDQR
ncbi:MAG: hypothetical protein H5U33_07915, partial [Pseudomonas sp.]|nr:hypothetical protein [Pseudomonas sp.]